MRSLPQHHGRERPKGGGTDKVLGAVFEHDLDVMSGGGEFMDDLWGAERPPSGTDGEEDQGPAACGAG
jgi:hypothetical protein